MYIRIEGPFQEGLFSIASDLQYWVRSEPAMRLLTAQEREAALSLKEWLWCNTPSPPREAYVDERARRPLTWFRHEACEHVKAAEQLTTLLRRGGLRIWRVRSTDPGVVLWEDDVQAVVRPNRINSLHWQKVEEKRAERAERAWNGDRTTIRRRRGQRSIRRFVLTMGV